jgi:hypothetical protein
MQVDRDSLEEAEVPKTPAKAKAPIVKPKSTPGAGVGGGSGTQVRSGGPGTRGLSEAVSLQLMAPMLDISRSLRRVIRQNMVF